MKWSWRIGSVAGIAINVHGTFLLLLAWVAVMHLWQGGSVADAGAAVLFVVCVFSIVVLHELGHALVAKYFGIRTRDITLLPIGGMARLERVPEKPRQELLVALAGPAVNVALALAVWVAIGTASVSVPLGDGSFMDGTVLAKLFWINVTLAVFNLIPAFPMDGGRALRALLAMEMDYVQATQKAASIGQAIALLFGFIGLFANPLLIFIALFVWIGAAEEATATYLNGALGRVPVTQAMVTQFQTLSPHDHLARAVEHIMAGFQADFPVVDGGRVIGVLTKANVVSGLSSGGPESEVGEFMCREVQTADAMEMVGSVLPRLRDSAARAVPVLRAGQLIGIATMDNVGEFLAIQAAITHRPQPAHIAV